MTTIKASFIAAAILLSTAIAYAQPKATADQAFWNNKEFWESPAMNIPYSDNLSEDAKIAGLSKFWSEVKYNFINSDLVLGLDWDKTYLDYLPKVRATRSTLEYYRVLEEMCAKLNDGHTRILPPAEVSEKLYSRPKIMTDLIEGKVIVTAVLDEALTTEGILTGVEITHVDGIPVKQYAKERVEPFSSDSTRQAKDLSVYDRLLLAGPAGEAVRVTFRNAEGWTFGRSLMRVPQAEWQKLAPARKPFDMKMLDGNVMYVELGTFVSDAAANEFEANFDAIAKADALIIDIRRNGGGNSSVGWQILGLLTNSPISGSRWRTREYHPTFRAWERPEFGYGEDAREYPDPSPAHFSKPVVVLTSPRTGSAAEDFLVAFRTLKRGSVIGEPTNGSTGQPLIISLPGGGRAGICTKYDSFPDGTPFVGVGIVPDVTVMRTVSDVRTGRDAVLERAIDEINKSQ